MSGATRFPVEVKIKRDVPAAMRDGAILYADIYRPTSGGPLPVLLMRLPYDKVGALIITYAQPIWYARQGFLVIVQDVRGRGRSGGEIYPFRHEAEVGGGNLAGRITATQTIFHDAAHPSRLVPPIIPR